MDFHGIFSSCPFIIANLTDRRTNAGKWCITQKVTNGFYEIFGNCSMYHGQAILIVSSKFIQNVLSNVASRLTDRHVDMHVPMSVKGITQTNTSKRG